MVLISASVLMEKYVHRSISGLNIWPEFFFITQQLFISEHLAHYFNIFYIISYRVAECSPLALFKKERSSLKKILWSQLR